MFPGREFDLVNLESMEEASQDYMRLFVDDVVPVERPSEAIWD
ncbi:MAG: hypothetical protein ACOY31_11590 [Bacillota bacterium]